MESSEQTFNLPIETVEGEIALIIQYQAGKSEALGVLAGAMRLIEAIDKLDADAPKIEQSLRELAPEYLASPVHLVGYTPPSIADVQAALQGIAQARASLPHHGVTIQTEYGDIAFPDTPAILATPAEAPPIKNTISNTGVEFLKVKSTDMLGQAQWTVIRNNRVVKVDLLHQSWLAAYQHRQHAVFPGDSLECRFEETISYDANHNELERKFAIIEVLRIITPPNQQSLL